MTSPAAGARPHDARPTGSTTPVDGSPRRPRRRRGGRGGSPAHQLPVNQAASGVPAADAAASPGGGASTGAAPTKRTPRRRLDEARLAARRAAVPKITYPDALPVSARRDDIAAAIRDHQVVIVAGETGSGKTTQIPKICLELGRGVSGMIGHTQPRRIAARTVASRIAQELESTVGNAVGFKVRFTDVVGEGSYIKLMTDG